MSVIFLESFDDGLFSQKWTAIGLATIEGTGRTVNRMIPAGVLGSTNPRHMFGAADEHATFIIGFAWMQNNYLDTSYQPMIGLTSDGGATTHITMSADSNKRLSVRRGTATELATTGPNMFQFATWYYMELKAVLHDTTGSIEVRMNGVPIMTASGIDTKNAGTKAVFDGFYFYQVNNNFQVRIDDLYVCNGAGSVNNDFLGDSRVHSLLPNANGNYSQFVGSDADSVDNYLLVDEGTPNTSDYVGSGVSGEKDSYGFPDLPAEVTVVRAVAQRAYAANSDAGARQARQFVRIAGTDYPDSDFNVGVGYDEFSIIHNVSPATGVAFTEAEFNAAEWGIEARA